MSAANPDANASTNLPGSTASSIRLPPITFLSRNNENNSPAIVLPIGQAFENRQPQSLLRDSKTPSLQRATGSSAFADEEGNDKVRLPTPQVLGIYSGLLQPDASPDTNRLQSTASDAEQVENGLQKSSQTTDQENGGKRPADQMDGTTKKLKGTVTIGKDSLHKFLAEVYPKRHHLGTIIYNPTTTWETLQVEQLHGMQEHDRERLLDIQRGFIERRKERFSAEQIAYIPVLPPLGEAYINSFLEVKIPYRFIKEFVNDFTAGKIQKRRELWGGQGGIYTDDSDVLSVLCHLGLFEDNLDLSETNSQWKTEDLVRPLRIDHDDEGVELLDLSVTLLLLPTLHEYHGFCRNGLNSRSWTGSLHDGLSFAVFSVKWESYVVSTSERNLSKLAQLENLQDRIAEQELLLDGRGWRFDYKYFRTLQQKYKDAQNGTEKLGA